MLIHPHPARARLLALALVLAAALLTLPSASPPAAPALLFLSPNTDEGLSLEESLRRLESAEHARYRRLADRILRELAVGPAAVHDAVGDWEGGVENSLVVVLTRCPDPATLRGAAAWFGLAADQKAVLAFRPDPRGSDVLATLRLPVSVAEARRLLDQHGIRERSILVEDGACRVLVLDAGGRRGAALATLAEAASGRLMRQRGHGESLTGATREEARRRYREALRGWKLVWDVNGQR